MSLTKEEETMCADLHGKKVTGELDGVVVGGQLDVVDAVLAVGIVQWELRGQDSSIQRTSATGKLLGVQWELWGQDSSIQRTSATG